jgi:hypothetical protein
LDSSLYNSFNNHGFFQPPLTFVPPKNHLKTSSFGNLVFIINLIAAISISLSLSML